MNRVDPLQHKYPHYTPYRYAGNKPVTFIDLDGLEEKPTETIHSPQSKKNANTNDENDPSLITKQRFEKVKKLFEGNANPVCITVFNNAVKETLNKPNLNLKNSFDISKTQKILEYKGFSGSKIPIDIYDKVIKHKLSVVELFDKGKGIIKSIGKKNIELSGDSDGIRAYGFAPAQGYHSLLIFHIKINYTDTFYVGDQGASGHGFITGGFQKFESIFDLDTRLIEIMKEGAKYYQRKGIDADITSFLFQLRDNSIRRIKKIDINKLEVKNEQPQTIELPK